MSKIFYLSILLVCLCPTSAMAGTCPANAGYLHPSHPASGGFFGDTSLATAYGITDCVFVDSVAGLDSNTGADETHPFLHAPGMPNCASNCAAVTASSTRGIIVKGGSHYHRSSGSPLMGGQWTIGAFGYLGIDQTWSNGGSFTRPIVDMDNSLSTSLVVSCSFNDGAASALNGLSLSSGTVIDGIEVTGGCSSGAGDGNYISNSGGIVERSYAHGWTMTTGAVDDSFAMFGGGSSSSRYLFNVVDGVDSSLGTVCNAANCVASTWGGSGAGTAATGWGMRDCWDVEYSVIRHASQGAECNNLSIFHDDLFEFIFEPTISSRHGNVVEAVLGNASFYFYNNIVRNVNAGVNIWPEATAIYEFNDVMENDGHATPDPNCLMHSPATNGQAGSVFVYNITADGTCGSRAIAQNPVYGTGSSFTFANNHILDRTGIFSGSAFWACTAGAGNTCTTKTDSGGEVFQTTAVANGQGYTLANDFAPTNVSNATVHAGINNTTACNAIPDATAKAACASGTSNGVTEVAGWGGFIAQYPGVTVNSRGTTFDAGSYQFSAPTQASPPSCSPGSGTYTANQTITCTNPNSGTTVICYSTSTTPATNGSGTGCTTGTQYTTALTVSANETLNVIAGTSTLTDSAVVTYSYVLQGGAPVCSPVGGTYIGTQSIALSQPQSLAIGYTTNGTSPVSNGSGGCAGSCTLYSGAISVASSETIKAIGMASGWTDSSIASCAYVINAPAATDMTMEGVTSSQGVTIVQ